MHQTCSACDAPATLACALCHTPLCAEHAVMGQPFITARQLATTTAVTALRAPALLGDLLFKELDKVPYCAACRAQLAARRTAEQLKFLGGVLLVLALLIGLIWYLAVA